jgi:hypothetical protein
MGMNRKSGFVILSAVAILGLAACNGEGSNGAILGSDAVDGTSQPVPSNGNVDPAPSGGAAPQIGASCHGSNPGKLCLSLRYVAYKDSAGKAVVSESETLTNLAQINQVWSQCDIAFEIGSYVAANPSDYGLDFNTASSSDLSRVRGAFLQDSSLLVVTTGAWSGTLGAGSANAWTTMPGGGTYGVVLESPVGTFPNIVAHELGHYLNLDHVSDTSDVMSPIIYSSSTSLTQAQCTAARAAATHYWSAMLR